MRISVKVKPNAKKESVLSMADGSLVVSLSAPAAEGKANAALVKLLAKHFGTAPSCITIVSCASSRTKRVEIFGLIKDLRCWIPFFLFRFSVQNLRNDPVSPLFRQSVMDPEERFHFAEESVE